MNITGQPDTATPTTEPTRRDPPTQAASIPAIVRGKEIAMLDGTTDKQDSRLLADINAAPDPFDGGCPADVCDDPAHGGRGGTMGDAAAATPSKPETEREYRDRIIDRAHLSGRKLGIYDVIAWLHANGHTTAAFTIHTNAETIKAKIESDAARGC